MTYFPNQLMLLGSHIFSTAGFASIRATHRIGEPVWHMNKATFIEALEEIINTLQVPKMLAAIDSLNELPDQQIPSSVRKEVFQIWSLTQLKVAALSPSARAVLDQLDSANRAFEPESITNISFEILSGQWPSPAHIRAHGHTRQLRETLFVIAQTYLAALRFLTPQALREQPDIEANTMTFTIQVPEREYLSVNELAELLELLAKLVESMCLYARGTSVQPRVLSIDSGSDIDIIVTALQKLAGHQAVDWVPWLLLIFKSLEQAGKGVDWLISKAKDVQEIRNKGLEADQKRLALGSEEQRKQEAHIVEMDLKRADIANKSADTEGKLADVQQKKLELRRRIVEGDATGVFAMIQTTLTGLDPEKPHYKAFMQALSLLLAKFEPVVALPEHEVETMLLHAKDLETFLALSAPPEHPLLASPSSSTNITEATDINRPSSPDIETPLEGLP